MLKFNLKKTTKNRNLRIEQFDIVKPSNSFLLYLILSLFLFYFLLFMLSNKTSPEINLVFSSVTGILTVYFLSYFGLKKILGNKAIKILVVAFIVRLVVGIVHYVMFIQPDYFINPLTLNYYPDYDYNHNQLIYISNIWHQYGFLSPMPDTYFINNKNPLILQFMALVYYFAGGFALNLAVWNSLMNSYSAAIISMITYYNTNSRKYAIIALTFAAFQPFGFISSIVWRDSTGLFIVALAAFLLINYRKNLVLGLILLPIAGFLASWHRSPYYFLIAILYYFIIKQERKLSFWIMSLMSLTIIPFIVMIYQSFTGLFLAVVDIGVTRGDSIGQTDNYLTLLKPKLIFEVPIRIIKAVIGAFPWAQFLKKVDGYEYQPLDYLTSVFSLAVYFMLFPHVVKKWKIKKEIDYSLFFGILIMILGMLAFNVHVAYIAIGFIFLVPEFATIYSKEKFIDSLLISFYFFVLLHFVFYAFRLSGKSVFGLAD